MMSQWFLSLPWIRRALLTFMNAAGGTYYKARGTVLEMLRDRGYQFDFEKYRAVTDSRYYQNDRIGVRSSDVALNAIDLMGRDKRGWPCVVHFTTAKMTARDRLSSLRAIYAIFLRVPEIVDHLHSLGLNENEAVVSLSGEVPLVLAGLHLIIVYDGSEQSASKTTRELTLLASREGQSPAQRYDVELLPLHTLTFNITKYYMTPRHSLLEEGEKRALLDSFTALIPPKELKAMEELKSGTGGSADTYYEALEKYVMGQLPKISRYDPQNVYYHGQPRDIYKVIRKGTEVAYRVVIKN